MGEGLRERFRGWVKVMLVVVVASVSRRRQGDEGEVVVCPVLGVGSSVSVCVVLDEFIAPMISAPFYTAAAASRSVGSLSVCLDCIAVVFIVCEGYR